MFDVSALAVAIHVLLAGLWIGADIGTFLSFRRVLDPSLSVESRRAMASYFAWIDMGPRTALVVMFGLGIYLTYDRSFGFQYGSWKPLAFIAIAGSVMWLALVWYLHWVNHPRAGEVRSGVHTRYASILSKVDFGWRGVVVVFLLVAGIGTLQSKSPALLDVLGWKMIMLAGIVVVGMILRIYLPGVLGHIGAIFTEGSTPDREAALRSAAVPVQGLVIVIWVLVFLIIWTSVTNL